MGILIEMTHYNENDRKAQTEKDFIKNGQLLSIMDSTIKRISVPVKCKGENGTLFD